MSSSLATSSATGSHALEAQYLKETLAWAKRALDCDLKVTESEAACDLYSRAIRSISVLISLIPADQNAPNFMNIPSDSLKSVLEGLLATYQHRKQLLRHRGSGSGSSSTFGSMRASSTRDPIENYDTVSSDGDVEMGGDTQEDDVVELDSMPPSPTTAPAVAEPEETSSPEAPAAPINNSTPVPIAENSINSSKNHVDDEDLPLQRAVQGCIIPVGSGSRGLEGVAGMKAAVQSLKETIFLPLKFPRLFKGERKPCRAILLYGPPGTGKTHVAKALAAEGKSTFFSISPADLMSKWFGQSEKMLRQLFILAQKRKPSIIFIDEIDAIASARGQDAENETSRRIKTELLIQMSSMEDGVLVLAATNLPWQIDSAVRRRFEKRIYVPLPDATTRVQILKLYMADVANSLGDEDYTLIAERTEGYSGSDLHQLVRHTIMEPIRKLEQATWFKKVLKPTGEIAWQVATEGEPCAEELSLLDIDENMLLTPDVTASDFIDGLQFCKCSVSNEDNEKYVVFTKEFGLQD